MKVEIYSKSNCPFCEKAKNWFKSHGYEYTEHRMDNQEERLAFYQKVPGARSVPQIFIDDKLIGTWDQFEAVSEMFVKKKGGGLMVFSETYKPFHYPWAVEITTRHEKVHWIEDELDLSEDVADWKSGKVSAIEKEYITNILRLFTQSDLSASTLVLEEGGNIGELLANQFVTSIEVDGNNQKWVATDGAGVFLFTEDGKSTLQHFTKENSPLPTNSVRSLAYEPQSGKIYMGTPNGLVAFQGNAYSPSENLKEVEVYPNPIRPNYTGLLTVRGLQTDCVVKITDIVGNAVFETTTTGGSIHWDLRSFSGKRVRSGVYLIFVATNDGLESAVEKVMIIN